MAHLLLLFSVCKMCEYVKQLNMQFFVSCSLFCVFRLNSFNIYDTRGRESVLYLESIPIDPDGNKALGHKRDSSSLLLS